MDLTDTFAPGTTILLRFRLFADPFVNGWGWVIDNLEIQAGTVTSVAAVPAPGGISLAQNSPNPARGATSISFALPEDGPVQLRVYDVAGRLVETLVDRPLAAGSHQVRLDRPGMASGVYFYRLTAAGDTRSRKMIVSR